MPHLQRRRRAILLAVGLAVVTAVIPTAPGSATASFTFYGSGFGHGLGMSQWGAYGLALRGWTTDQILTHYYSHTVVQQAGAAPSLLRIGLTQGRSTIHLQAINGDVTLRIGNSTDGALVGRIPSPQTWVVTTVSGRYRILNANGNRVGGRDWGDATHNLYASYADVGARVKVPEGGATYNRGFFEFNLYACGPCQMRVILTIPPRAYLYGLAEVPSSWPMAALRAQAIAGRSYAFVKAASGQHRTGCNCALYDSSSDQVYIGWNKEFGTDGWRWVLAVNQTAGQVVTYQGATVEAEYMSSSGGYTENNENVWGGTPLPWLRGVCDPGDYTSANPNRVWSVTFSTAQVTSALRPYTGDIGTVVGFGDARRGVSGRIESVPVSGGKSKRHGGHPNEVRQPGVRAGAPNGACGHGARGEPAVVRDGWHLPQRRRERDRVAEGPDLR